MERRRGRAAAVAAVEEDAGLEIEFNGDESEGDDSERLRRRRRGQRAVPERDVVVTAAALPRKVTLAA